MSLKHKAAIIIPWGAVATAAGMLALSGLGNSRRPLSVAEYQRIVANAEEAVKTAHLEHLSYVPVLEDMLRRRQ